MKVTMNNKGVETGASNLLILPQQLDLPHGGIAIAVNNRIVPRVEWKNGSLAKWICQLSLSLFAEVNYTTVYHPFNDKVLT